VNQDAESRHGPSWHPALESGRSIRIWQKRVSRRLESARGAFFGGPGNRSLPAAFAVCRRPSTRRASRVSSPCQSSRTCGFPASGFHSRSCLRLRKACDANPFSRPPTALRIGHSIRKSRLFSGHEQGDSVELAGELAVRFVHVAATIFTESSRLFASLSVYSSQLRRKDAEAARSFRLRNTRSSAVRRRRARLQRDHFGRLPDDVGEMEVHLARIGPVANPSFGQTAEKW